MKFEMEKFCLDNEKLPLNWISVKKVLEYIYISM